MLRKLLGSIVRGGDRIISGLTNAGAWLAWLCLWAMAVLIVVDITGRRFFGRSTHVADELSGYFLVTITFLAAAYTLVRGKHIKVTAVMSVLPAKARRGLTITNSIMALAFTVIVAWYSLKLPLFSLKAGTIAWTTLETPMFIPELIVPVGLFILALATLAHAIRLIKPTNKPKGTQ